MISFSCVRSTDWWRGCRRCSMSWPPVRASCAPTPSCFDYRWSSASWPPCCGPAVSCGCSTDTAKSFHRTTKLNITARSGMSVRLTFWPLNLKILINHPLNTIILILAGSTKSWNRWWCEADNNTKDSESEDGYQHTQVIISEVPSLWKVTVGSGRRAQNIQVSILELFVWS